MTSQTLEIATKVTLLLFWVMIIYSLVDYVVQRAWPLERLGLLTRKSVVSGLSMVCCSIAAYFILLH